MHPFLLALALLAPWATANAPEGSGPAACARIRPPLERLACFDHWYPPATDAGDPGAAPSPTPEAGPQGRPDASVPVRSPTPRPRESPAREPAAPKVDRPAEGTVHSAIAAIRRQQQRMVFVLENGQVWIQTAPRPLSVAIGDAVSVRGTLLGGHLLRTETGATTRVRRAD